VTTLLLDGERIVANYLRAHAAVTAITTRVVGQPPSNTDTAWVRVTMLDAQNAPGSIPEHLISYLLQADCYAGATGGQPEAKSLGFTVRAALKEMEGTTIEGAVITCVHTVGFARVPDSDLKDSRGQDRERIVGTFEVYLHA
jgi:hypothetical protein